MDQDLTQLSDAELAYEQRVRALEEEGLTRSDAQAAVDAEDLLGAQDERAEQRINLAEHLRNS